MSPLLRNADFRCLMIFAVAMCGCGGSESSESPAVSKPPDPSKYKIVAAKISAAGANEKGNYHVETLKAPLRVTGFIQASEQFDEVQVGWGVHVKIVGTGRNRKEITFSDARFPLKAADGNKVEFEGELPTSKIPPGNYRLCAYLQRRLVCETKFNVVAK